MSSNLEEEFFYKTNLEFAKHCDKNGYQIKFSKPYHYLNMNFHDYNLYKEWWDTKRYYKYINWNPPISRIEGWSGDILFCFVELNKL